MYPNVLFDKSMYNWKYLLTHPWKLFQDLKFNIKCSWQRIARGWSDSDWPNMGEWIIEVFPPMLRAMADKGWGYPGTKQFDTAEKWHDWLHYIASEIESCSEDACNKRNEFYDEWVKSVFKEKFDASKNEIFKKYSKRSEELAFEANVRIANAFRELGENFSNLWD